eukprot:9472496-Pyramimonas_sp.AAC.1
MQVNLEFGGAAPHARTRARVLADARAFACVGYLARRGSRNELAWTLLEMRLSCPPAPWKGPMVHSGRAVAYNVPFLRA